jgi:hypothetical protein
MGGVVSCAECDFEIKELFMRPYARIREFKGKQGKAILVTGHGGPQGFETSRLPHFLDNRLSR